MAAKPADQGSEMGRALATLGQELQARQATSARRASGSSTGSFGGKGGKSIPRKSVAKGWVQQQWDRPLIFSEGQQAPGLETNKAIVLVNRVTRFATFMCFVIAVLKVVVYEATASAVVKTSTLDALGDLTANLIAVFTCWKMSRVDTDRYPAGQSKFESLGVLIFATLMATFMFANIVSNLEELVKHQEVSNEVAVKAFWSILFFGSKDSWAAESSPSWEALRTGALDETKGIDIASLSTAMRKTVNAENFSHACQEIAGIVHEVAEVKTQDKQNFESMIAVVFLGICAFYKLCLWLYCVQVAIPKSGSTVLEALARDKRNDVVATSFVICCLLVSWLMEDGLGDFARKLDPLSSVALSIIIMVTWIQLLLEQLSALSQASANSDVLAAMRSTVNALVSTHGCTVGRLKMYRYNVKKYMLHVELGGPPICAFLLSSTRATKLGHVLASAACTTVLKICGPTVHSVTDCRNARNCTTATTAAACA